MDVQYRRILQAAAAVPWAILPNQLAVIQDLLAMRVNGERLSADQVQERLATAGPTGQRATARRGTAVAIINLVGVIRPRGMITESSGAVSIQRFTRAFRTVLADPNVTAIVIDIDSPGGQVGGVAELSREIYQARGRKRIVAVANHLAASAAYWIGSAAGELVVSPSGEVGSIGVLSLHQDISKMLEKQGVTVNLITAGRYKGEGNPFEPLNSQARAAIQGRVDEYYSMFTADVARHRGVDVGRVRNGFGQGRVVGAETARRLGMVDRIGTLDSVVNELVTGKKDQTAAMADMDMRRRRLRVASL
jgi:capsid assembly protease